MMIVPVILWGVLGLFVAVPLVLSMRGWLASDARQLGKLGWMAASTALRALIAGLVGWIFWGGGTFETVRQISPPRQISALVDVSSSVIQPGGDVQGFAEAVAKRLDEVAAALGVRPAEIDIYTFDRQTVRAGRGLDTLRRFTAAQVAPPGNQSSALQEAIASLPTGIGDEALTLLISDGWADGEIPGQGLSPDLIRAIGELGQPIYTLELPAQEGWSTPAPEQPRLVALDKMPAEKFIAGSDHSRAMRFAVEPSVSAGAAQSLDLSFWAHGRDELITGFACRDTEAKGVGRVVVPQGARTLIECLPLETLAEAPGAAFQAVLSSAIDLDSARLVIDRMGSSVGRDGVNPPIVQFLERGYVPHVLVLDGAQGGNDIPSILQTSLENLGWTWDRVTPQMWADRRFAGSGDGGVDFFAYDAVLMADFPPGGFGLKAIDDTGDWSTQRANAEIDRTLRGLADYVGAGGGLFLSGGEESFGVGGYASTPIEPLLPIQLDPKGAAGDPPVVVVAVLDVSASLWYQEETFSRAREYVVSSMEDLPSGSQIRVLGFSDEPHELVPLQAFQDAEWLDALLEEALVELGQEFERRRMLGLQPEGVDVYSALLAGYRTFDRLKELADEQAVIAGGLLAVEGEFSHVEGAKADLEKRLFLVLDAQDQDFLSFTRWTVDEVGAFQRTSAIDLALERFEQDGIVLNSIGMTYGEDSLPPLERIVQAENQVWFERFNLGVNMARALLQLSRAGGGTSTLDQFEIPLGSLSRSMKAYVNDGVALSPSLNHRFLPPQLAVGPPASVPGAAVAPAKDGARSILYADYTPENGQGLELGIWTEWVTDAQNIRQVVSSRQALGELLADSGQAESGTGNGTGAESRTRQEGRLDSLTQTDAQQVLQGGALPLRFGGGVSVLSTTLRDGNDQFSGFSDYPLHQAGMVRMLDWLVRTRARDEFSFSAQRIAPQGQSEADPVSLALVLSSQGEFSISDAKAQTWTLEFDQIRNLERSELANDELPKVLGDYAEAGDALNVVVSPMPTGSEARSQSKLQAVASLGQLQAAMNDDAAVLVTFEVRGTDGRGQTRTLDYRLFVFPEKLGFASEVPGWRRGQNVSLLKDVAELSGGGFVPWEGQAVDLSPLAAPQPIATQITQDWRWLAALVIIFAFIADFLIREYRIGREE